MTGITTIITTGMTTSATHGDCTCRIITGTITNTRTPTGKNSGIIGIGGTAIRINYGESSEFCWEMPEE
jgi:hypothetical protein